MIGYYIKGKDLQGKPCEGIILDAPLVPQTVLINVPGQIGGMPAPLSVTGYLVMNEHTHTIHIISPASISEIMIPVDQPE